MGRFTASLLGGLFLASCGAVQMGATREPSNQVMEVITWSGFNSKKTEDFSYVLFVGPPELPNCARVLSWWREQPATGLRFFWAKDWDKRGGHSVLETDATTQQKYPMAVHYVFKNDLQDWRGAAMFSGVEGTTEDLRRYLKEPQ